MSDRELLELAAKAAGNGATWSIAWGCMIVIDGDIADSWTQPRWNPLLDDGDALRLAVALRLEVNVKDYGTSARAYKGKWEGCESHISGGIENSTRRAIVLAAAEIGRNMP